MIEILFYSYLTSLHIYICGYLFYYIIIDKNETNKNNIFEIFFYGCFLISFIALFLNFFTSLNIYINTVLFFLPLIAFLMIPSKIFIKKILILAVPISVLFTITVSYDGTYRPDAGSYHLPYISILNENKILIGINNIHFRFGHTSIIQYLSAIYNNLLFGEKGITITLGLIFCNFIGYCIYHLFNKKNNQNLKIVIFLILAFVLFRVNRYSDFGNDAPANLLYFYLIFETIRENNDYLKIKKTIFASTFIFLNKITLLLCFLIPIYLILKKYKANKLINKISIFSFIFIALYFGKNLMISGCVIFPVEQTCVKSLYWYDKDSNRSSNAINARLENEAWTKGWINQKYQKKPYKEYLDNFNWIDNWLISEGKTVSKKMFPFIFFLLILYFSIIIFELKNSKEKKNNIFLNKDYYLCLIVSLLGSILWFLKFPVFRYGYGYLITFVAISILFYIKNFRFFYNETRLEKSLKYLIIVLVLGVTLKNINRINNGISNQLSIWPNIYDSDNKENTFSKKENIAIKKNNQIIFYKSKKNECYYSQSPCTHFFNGNDFTLEEINIKKVKSYKIYYFEN